MPVDLERIRSRLASLAKRFRKGKERDENTLKESQDEATANAPLSLESPVQRDVASAVPVPGESILKFTPAKWIENDSIADTDSTITRNKALNLRQPDVSSSIHAEGDPSRTRGSSVRAERNDAVQPLRSMLPSRNGSSFYYIQNGKPDPSKPSRVLHGQGHRYCCPNPEDLQGLCDNSFESEDDMDPDWRVNARRRGRAGHIDNVEDFSEWHLAERWFFNSTLFTPAGHLEGSHKAAVQDLNALNLENIALRASALEAVANADRLEREVEVLQQRLGHVDADIEEIDLLLKRNGRESAAG